MQKEMEMVVRKKSNWFYTYFAILIMFKISYHFISCFYLKFLCKNCNKVFRKDLTTFEEADEFCPHCDNQYIIDAETPEVINNK